MKVLIVEDNQNDRELLKLMLEERFQHSTKFREAASLKDALGYLAHGDIDCVLLDLHLPDSHGRETFTKLQMQYPEVPIVVMTHTQDRVLAIELVKLGAADYVTKNYTDEEGIFQRILLAIEKHKHSVRVPSEDVASVHRVERARAQLMEAHRSGTIDEVRSKTVEATAAAADLTRRMFTEIQKLSAASESHGRKLNHVTEVTDKIQLEFLEGTLNQPSIKSRLARLESSLRTLQDDHRFLTGDVQQLQTGRTEADTKAMRVSTDTAPKKNPLKKYVILGVSVLVGLATILGVFLL